MCVLPWHTNRKDIPLVLVLVCLSDRGSEMLYLVFVPIPFLSIRKEFAVFVEKLVTSGLRLAVILH